jgi:uncharacterized metal-binding protein YceD (DUF177 family)
MIIRLSDIPAEGLAIDTVLPLEPLNARLQQGESHGILFTTAPRVEITVHKSVSGAETRGKIRSSYRQPCSLCSKELDRDLELDANFVLRPLAEGLEEVGSDELLDDIGVVYYENDRVDLEDMIHETLILSLSIFWQPPRDATGRCTLCHLSFSEVKKTLGAPPEESTARVSLGDLLKKAGLN